VWGWQGYKAWRKRWGIGNNFKKKYKPTTCLLFFFLQTIVKCAWLKLQIIRYHTVEYDFFPEFPEFWKIPSLQFLVWIMPLTKKKKAAKLDCKIIQLKKRDILCQLVLLLQRCIRVKGHWFVQVEEVFKGGTQTENCCRKFCKYKNRGLQKVPLF